MSSARRHYEQASALFEAGRLGEAEQECRRSLALAPQAAEPQNLLAIVLSGQGRQAEAIKAFESLLARRPDFVPALGNLALILRGQHRHADALVYFQRLAAAEPNSSFARKHIAASLIELGRTTEAIAALDDALSLDPGDARLTHMRAALSGEAADSPPAEFVRDLFDDYAGSFEAHLVQELAYDVPASLRRMVDGLGPRRFARALDLGCGTGLSGAAFADSAATIVGVDVSPNMIREARRKGIYAALHEDTIERFFAALPVLAAPFDLVIAADVLIYVGRLDGLFTSVARRMPRCGLFGFSIERLRDGDFKLQTSGRYAHSIGYVERLAGAHGFDVAAREDTIIRTGYPGDVVVLKRR